MILIKVQPTGIKDVFIQAKSDREEELSMAIWPIVRQHVRALNRDLQTILDAATSETIQKNEGGGGCSPNF